MCWTPKEGESFLNEREKEKKTFPGEKCHLRSPEVDRGMPVSGPMRRNHTVGRGHGKGVELGKAKKKNIKNLVYVILSGAVILII